MRVSRATVAVIHGVCLIPGIVLCTQFALGLLQRHFSGTDLLKSWAPSVATPELKAFLTYLITFACIGGVMVLAYLFLRRRGALQVSGKGVAAFVAYELACILLPCGFDMLLRWALWMLLIGIIPLFLVVGSKNLSQRQDRGALVGSVLMLSIALIGLYATQWNPHLRFLNDYSGLDEQTILADGRVVGNQSFLEEHRIPGKYPYDPCQSTSGDADGAVCMYMLSAPTMDRRLMFDQFPPGQGLSYDWDHQAIRIFRSPSEEEAESIQEWSGANPLSLRPAVPVAKEAVSDTDVADFLAKNKIELRSQGHLGRFLYHHAFLFLPALEEVKGEGRVLPAQYGMGLTSTLAAFLKVVPEGGFQDYYALYWIAIGAYLALLAALVWYVTGSAWSGTLGAALAMLAVLATSPYALRIAPGFNPIRHFPDVLCLLVVYIDYRDRNWLSALLRAVAIGVLLWWNREFGLFFLAGSNAWQCLELMEVGAIRHRLAARMALEIAMSVATMAYFKTATVSDLAAYNLAGVGALVTSWSDVAIWLAIWAPALFVLVWLRFVHSGNGVEKGSKTVLDLAGVGLAYSMAVSVYALWNPSPPHIAVVCLVGVVPLVLSLDQITSGCAGLAVHGAMLRRYLAVFASLEVLAVTMLFYLVDYRAFDQAFANHRSFTWQFPALVGVSTADPAPVQESLKLIDKYQPSGRLVLLSRFDVVLSITSGRQGLLPYVELPSSLVGWAMVDRIASRIEGAKPSLLFVDRDIWENKEWSSAYAGEGGLPPSEDAYRIGSWAALTEVFRSISSCYVAGEAAGLLQVWHRTCK